MGSILVSRALFGAASVFIGNLHGHTAQDLARAMRAAKRRICILDNFALAVSVQDNDVRPEQSGTVNHRLWTDRKRPSLGLLLGRGAAAIMKPADGDRRMKRRYDIQLPVRFVVRAENHTLLAGEGATRNLSSGGAAVMTACEIPAGSSAELWILWPATAEDIDTIELHIDGLVIRSSAREVAVQARRHHFIVSRKPSAALKQPASKSALSGA